jgi:hypothetical protein
MGGVIQIISPLGTRSVSPTPASVASPIEMDGAACVAVERREVDVGRWLERVNIQANKVLLDKE